MRAKGYVCLVVALWVGAMVGGQICAGQSQPAEMKVPEEVRTFFLTNVTDPNEAMDIQTDLRNILPHAHMYYVESQGALSIKGPAEEIAQAEKMISELDRKRKVYRITYSITDADNGKPAGTRHVELIIPTHGKTVVKEGTRVPIVTGSTDQDSGKPSSQVQYVDVGINIEAALEGTGDALRLRTKVELSSVADQKSGIGAQDPVIEQTALEGIAMLAQSKPTLLGSLDLPGGGRREEISVQSELLK
jgi:type II secretory pathway component GspD/PulD (secretin)